MTNWHNGTEPPEDNRQVIVLKQSKNGNRTYDLGWYLRDEYAHWVTHGSANVVKWCELPEMPEV